jgi:Cys-rich protein (TIGR01571 family)
MAVLNPPSATYPITATNFSPLPQPERGGTWHTSLFSCASPSICLTSLFCPCVSYGRTQYRLSRRSAKSDPTNFLGFNPCCNPSCVAFGVLCGVNAILAAVQKTRVRKTYGMEQEQGAGGVLDDLWKGVCCCCCSVAQDEKEMKWREEEARRITGASGSGKDQGYVPVGGMSFRPT